MLVVRLVVLVEGVACLQVVLRANAPVHAESAREVAIALGLFGRAYCLAKEVACTSCKVEACCRAPRKLLLEVYGFVAIYG